MKQVSLPFYKAMQVSGSDATQFLQGQLTNDINKTIDCDWQLSAYCIPTGQVIAIFPILKAPQGYIMVTDESVFESTVNRLKMFVLRSDVIFTELETPVIGLLNDEHVNLSLNPVSEASETTIEAWQIAAMMQQWPRINQDSSQKHVAQFLNLDLNAGIDFKKGCYAGQEVIARLHYRGKATKRMVLIKAHGTIECSNELELAYDDHSAQITVLDCVTLDNETWIQAIISLKTLENAQGQFSHLNTSIEVVNQP